MLTLNNTDSRYALLRKLAGRSNVWLAYDNLTNKEVVLKLQATGRTIEAAVLLLLLTVQGVVQLIASLSQLEVIAEGSAIVGDALILEYYPFGDLWNLVKRPRYDPDDERVVRTIFIQITTALYNVHERNIAHLDIKPTNILIDCSGHALLADFDIAVTGNLEQITWNCGTPGYKAPEVGRRAYSGKAADVFSLGVTFFYLRMKELPVFDMNVLTRSESRKRFWSFIANKNCTISAGFCSLFSHMVAIKPLCRPTLREVLANPWLQGPQVSPHYIQRLLRD